MLTKRYLADPAFPPQRSLANLGVSVHNNARGLVFDALEWNAALVALTTDCLILIGADLDLKKEGSE